MNTKDNIEQCENYAKELHQILKYNEQLYDVIKKAERLCNMPYYIGAGCITQSVWNYQNSNAPMYGIEDLDFVYFDEKDVTYEGENSVLEHIIKGIGEQNIHMDIKNQARVHLWYQQHFGYAVEPYKSLEEAIDTWPTTASAIGVRLESGKLKIYAPFGLGDMFQQVVIANKLRITREIYESKTKKWSQKWDTLKIIPWD
ncbi:MAG: hypothetical protein K0R05_2725 [Anaerocolumna sp.]|jgi:hypothetical protein|nr:hypothetical protein [Anaerocolumna sp.]